MRWLFGVRAPRALAAWIALMVVASTAAAVAMGTTPKAEADVVAAATPPQPVATVVMPPATAPATTAPPTTEPPTTTTAPPPPTTVAPPSASLSGPLPPPGTFTFTPYQGFGSWVDVYDWTEIHGHSAFGLADVDRMASLGVQTMYIQVTRWDAPTLILEPDRLVPLINRARGNGMRVVAWYLPDLGDVNLDLQRLLAAAQLPVDGLGVDIESRSVPDVEDRNQRLIALSDALRAQLPGQVLSAIVLPPVLMEDVNPNYWPGYPWAALAPYYDVWQPMSYWTGRLSNWRDAYTYTAVNIDRVREHIGNPEAIVHTIGGIGDGSTPDDIAGMLQAAVDRGVIGGSLYDYRTTGDDLWQPMQGFRVE